MSTPDDGDSFARPTFVGPRFDGGRLPVDSLSEITVYADLIVEMATAMFLARHPHRSRRPAGLPEKLGLSLTQVERGSGVAVLKRAPTDDRMPGTESDIFDEARETLHALVRGDAPSFELPRRLKQKLKMFGRSLRPDEALDLRGPSGRTGPTARLDRQSRRKLLLVVDESYEDFALLEGVVTAVNSTTKTFTLTHDGGALTGSWTDSVEERVLTAARMYRTMRIALWGSVEYNKEGDALRIQVVDDIAIASMNGAPGLEEQLATLSQLENGWFDGDGTAYSPTAMQRLGHYARELVDIFTLPRPFIYPMPDGTVRLEWPFGEWGVGAYIDLATGAMEFYATNVETQQVEEYATSLLSPQNMEDAVTFIGRFSPFARSAP